jgi:hypothetical protein
MKMHLSELDSSFLNPNLHPAFKNSVVTSPSPFIKEDHNHNEMIDPLLLEQKLALDDSLQTVHNLNLLRSEDAEKLKLMDKKDIITYYEGILDKCHEVIN